MQNQDKNIEQIYRNHLILWSVVLMSQFIFLAVVFIVKPELLKFDFSKPLLDENAVLIIALAFFGVINLVLSFVIRAQFAKMAIAEQNVSLLQQGIIIGLAFSESVGIFGVILAFIDNYQYFFIWNALAILAIILHFPRRQNLLDVTYKR